MSVIDIFLRVNRGRAKLSQAVGRGPTTRRNPERWEFQVCNHGRRHFTGVRV